MSQNKSLTWRHLKGLHELYTSKRTRRKIADNDYIKHLINKKKLIKYKTGNVNILEARPGYRLFYEQEHKENYQRYQAFFEANEVESDAKREYLEDDIITLMFIADHKEDFVSSLSTIKSFSAVVFEGKGSKYLENHSSLKSAVCKILGIHDFPEKDPQNLQWRLVVDCPKPQVVVLCENLANLKSPWLAREHNFELWYVGGNNIGIIDFISKDKLLLPIYYFCDWDYHGLLIYQNIKSKFKKASKEIKILIPPNLDNSLPVDSPYHKSKWNGNKKLSGLDESLFSDEEQNLIQRLIKLNHWVEEESLNLISLLKNNLLLSSL